MKAKLLFLILLSGSLMARAQFTKVNGFSGGGIRSLQFIDGLLYAQNDGYSNNQLFVSSDTGRSWRDISPGTRMYPYTGVSVNKIGSRLYVGAYYTTNNGVSWTRNNNFPLGEQFTVSNGVVYYWKWISGNQRKVYRSTDQLATSAELNNATIPLDTNFNYRYMFATTSGVAIYTRGGLYHTTNAGNTWQQVPMPVADYNQMSFIKVTGDDVYYRLNSDDSVHISNNLGVSWSAIQYQYYDVVDVVRSGTKYYICSPMFPIAYADVSVSARSTAVTGNFDDAIGRGMTMFNMFGRMLYVNNNTLLMTSDNMGVIRLNAPAQHYDVMNNGLNCASVTTLGGNGAVTLAFKKHHNYEKTYDKGATWTADTGNNIIHREYNLPVTTILEHRGKIYTGATGYERVFVSSDSARSWKEIPRGLDVILNGLYGGVVSMVAAGDTIYAGANNGYVYRLEGDSLWIPLSVPSGQSNDVTAMTGVGPYLFAGTDQGTAVWGSVYRSSDKGRTWTDMSPGTQLYGVTSLVSAGGRLFASSLTSVLGVMRSDDTGRTWRSIGNGLPGNTIVGRLQPYQSRIYGITQYGGLDDSLYKLWSYDIQRDKWSCESCSQPQLDITSFRVTDSVIYLGTDGDGLWRKRVVPSTGVALFEKDNDDIRVYPNPGQSPVIRFDKAEQAKGAVVLILGSTGQLIRREPVQHAVQPLNTAGLPDGIYYLQIVREGRTAGFIKWVKG